MKLFICTQKKKEKSKFDWDLMPCTTKGRAILWKPIKFDENRFILFTKWFFLLLNLRVICCVKYLMCDKKLESHGGFKEKRLMSHAKHSYYCMNCSILGLRCLMGLKDVPKLNRKWKSWLINVLPPLHKPSLAGQLKF